MDSYAGFRPEKGWSPATVPASIDARDFFDRFVATRTPVIIAGSVDPALRVDEWGMLPDVLVWVEKRDPTRLSYGTGVKVPMRMRELCAHFARGEDGLYLTTQPLPEDPTSGKPVALFASPLAEMRGRFPVRPRLAGNLSPSSVNLWLGNSPVGSSSNLHHDFHDNFYVLLGGRKRFTIAPPSDAAALSPHGSLARIHPNGLINYAGVPTRADGAPPGAAVEFLRAELRRARAGPLRARLGRELREAEAAARSLSEGDAASVGGDDDEGDEDSAGAGDAAADMWAALTAKPTAQRQSVAAAAPRAAAPRAKGGRGRSGVSDPRPPPPSASPSEDPPSHFSRIDLPALRASAALPSPSSLDAFRNVQSTPEARARWPAFAACATLAAFDVLPGQSLFLPAGWWHEVVSFAEERPGAVNGSGEAQSAPASYPAGNLKRRRRAGGSSDGGAAPPPEAGDVEVRVPSGCHKALNFWFHPPTEARFEQPYPDGFAEHLFVHASSSASS